jgi:cell division transport system ATP-binding protein
LHYGQGPDILSGVSFRLEPGSFHFLLGASGAGKSSLLKCLYLGQQPSSGRISLFGRDVSTLTREDRALMRRRIGVVFQDFHLIDHLTALQNVALPLTVSGEPEAKAQEKVRELLTWVGLADCMDAYPPTLSGGQQQRIAIARAVIGRPSLLLADEPTGNVDDRIAMRLLFLFQELHRTGTTVLIATHSEAFMRRFKQPCLRLEAGHIAMEPAQPETAALRDDRL